MKALLQTRRRIRFLGTGSAGRRIAGREPILPRQECGNSSEWRIMSVSKFGLYGFSERFLCVDQTSCAPKTGALAMRSSYGPDQSPRTMCLLREEDFDLIGIVVGRVCERPLARLRSEDRNFLVEIETGSRRHHVRKCAGWNAPALQEGEGQKTLRGY